MRYFFIFLALTLLSCPLHAQDEEPFPPTEEEIREAMYSGAASMDEGQYLEAQEYFLWVLKNAKRLPAELAFFFGKNSYFLGQDQQSIDWLTKYIELKGTQGLHYAEASRYLNLAEIRFQADAEDSQEEGIAPNQVVFSLELDCEETPRVVCPVCQGDGVLISTNALGRQYSTCPKCSGTGSLTCEQYNELVK